jgi:AcrR family transcriptional regulator
MTTNQMVAIVVGMTATDSKRRLLDAASAEFAERGLAGGRVARIAASAKVNKQLIYAYFGDKDALFDTVLARRFEDLTAAVPMHPEDLPQWVVDQFDYIIANPDMMRLAIWQELERPEQVPCIIERDYQQYIARVANAQREGKVSTDFSALDIIVMLAGLAASWYSAFAPRLNALDDAAWRDNVLATHREALHRAATTIVAPNSIPA